MFLKAIRADRKQKLSVMIRRNSYNIPKAERKKRKKS